MSAGRSRIRSLRIGDIDIRQGYIMTADLSQLETLLDRSSGGRVHGIIGQDVLREHRALIDVARPMLYLQREDLDPAPIPAGRCAASGDRAVPVDPARNTK